MYEYMDINIYVIGRPLADDFFLLPHLPPQKIQLHQLCALRATLQHRAHHARDFLGDLHPGRPVRVEARRVGAGVAVLLFICFIVVFYSIHSIS